MSLHSKLWLGETDSLLKFQLWNKPAVAANILNAGASSSVASTADAERIAEAALDGRYAFKRRRGCIYRSSLFSNPSEGKNYKIFRCGSMKLYLVVVTLNGRPNIVAFKKLFSFAS